jgi:hypothetical protein
MHRFVRSFAGRIARSPYRRSLVAALSFVALTACGVDDAKIGGIVSSGGGSTSNSLSIVSGNNQVGPVSQNLTDSLTVRVMSSLGQAAPGIGVTWSVLSGGGSLSSTSSTTDSQGLARVAFSPGQFPGTNTVQAAISGSAVVFTETGR